MYKIKTLNADATIGSFYEKKLLLRKLQMSYYPEPDSHIGYVIKVELDLSNYATDFIALKAELHKLDINKLFNFLTG